MVKMQDTRQRNPHKYHEVYLDEEPSRCGQTEERTSRRRRALYHGQFIACVSVPMLVCVFAFACRFFVCVHDFCVNGEFNQ